MFNFRRKYDAEENTLRESVPFDMTDAFLKLAVSVERTNLGKISEKTVLMHYDSSDKTSPEYHYKISREQHDDLVERFRVLHNL